MATIPPVDIDDGIDQLLAIAQLATLRFEAMREQGPRAAGYLCPVLAAARQLARHARRRPALWAIALTLTSNVFEAAARAEQEDFAQGKHTVPYLSLLVATATLRVSIAEQAAAASVKQQSEQALDEAGRRIAEEDASRRQPRPPVAPTGARPPARGQATHSIAISTARQPGNAQAPPVPGRRAMPPAIRPPPELRGL